VAPVNFPLTLTRRESNSSSQRLSYYIAHIQYRRLIMRKDRFGRYLPIMTAVTAIAFTPNLSRAQSAIEKTESAVSSNAERAETTVAHAANETSDSQSHAKKVTAAR
jgi:hypothetical protein